MYQKIGYIDPDLIRALLPPIELTLERNLMYQKIGYIDPDLIRALLPPIELTFKPDSGYIIAPLPDEIAADAKHRLGGLVPGEWLSARIIAIKPGGIIPLHMDARPYDEEKRTRYHVVLTTNPFCWNYHDESVQHLVLGGIYTVDETLPHASVNWGDTDRVHLVIDVASRAV